MPKLFVDGLNDDEATDEQALGISNYIASWKPFIVKDNKSH